MNGDHSALSSLKRLRYFIRSFSLRKTIIRSLHVSPLRMDPSDSPLYSRDIVRSKSLLSCVPEDPNMFTLTEHLKRDGKKDGGPLTSVTVLKRPGREL